MCRLAAYIGPTIPLKQFLLDPPHSLVRQSWEPKELHYAKLNADGFGFGWYGLDEAPAIYTNPAPIWNDTNLDYLARSLESDLWLANVRSATQGSAVNQVNTQPFHDADLIYLHNGFIQNFRTHCRSLLEARLDPEFSASIQGNTDSEYLFALFRQLLAEEPDLPLEAVLEGLFESLEEWAGQQEALLNIVITDGQRLYAARHAFNHDCPSLYYITDDESFPGAQLIASEPLTQADFWQPVPEHHILILDPEQPPELIPL